MKEHCIDLSSMLLKGHVLTEMKNVMLLATTTKRLTTEFDRENLTINHYIYLEDTYRLPLRIDLTVKIDSPGLYLFLGDGHLNFGTPWSDNRRIDDIVEPNCKARFFHNHIPLNEFVNISVVYAYKAMQVLINGEERFYSQKEKYMKSKQFEQCNQNGFIFKIACTKRTNLVIESLKITEFDGTVEILHKDVPLPKPITTNVAVNLEGKPTFESCISLLPKEIQEEIIKTDSFLRSLKPLKFKRQIEKHGNKITYLASDYGFSYSLYPSNDVMHHSLWWYIITGCKPEFWQRKADMMEVVLNKLADTSEEFAERMFNNLKECIACREGCTVRTLYEHKDKKKLTCHGLMEFKMCASDFEEARSFISTINKLLT